MSDSDGSDYMPPPPPCGGIPGYTMTSDDDDDDVDAAGEGKAEGEASTRDIVETYSIIKTLDAETGCPMINGYAFPGVTLGRGSFGRSHVVVLLNPTARYCTLVVTFS